MKLIADTIKKLKKPLRNRQIYQDGNLAPRKQHHNVWSFIINKQQINHVQKNLYNQITKYKN